MADSAQITTLRNYLNELDDTAGWTDQRLNDLIDYFGGDVEQAAANGWIQKAGTYAALVDVSESGSSRRMSSLMDHALRMAATFRDGETGIVDPATRRPRTREIVRPS